MVLKIFFSFTLNLFQIRVLCALHLFLFLFNSDTQVERNALISRVYLKLKEFCHELGYEFHVVDIHWGIQDAFLDDHMSSEISKIELTTCQDLSTGPSFVVRYCNILFFFSFFLCGV